MADGETDILHLQLIKEEVPMERITSPDQKDPGLPHIREEQEYLWTNRREEQLLEAVESNKFSLSIVHRKTEDDAEKPQLRQCRTQQSREEVEPPGTSSAHLHLAKDVSESSDNALKESRAPDLRQRVRTLEKPFDCDVCGKRFTRAHFVKRHMMVHTGEKPWSCDVCGKRFTNKSNLNKHLVVHTGEKPWSCGVCAKRFTQTGSLKKHMMIHTGEKPFHCDVCGKRFRHENNFRRHTVVHTGEKPWSCDVCGKSFTQTGSLKRHMMRHT
ncbi:gastrula zinc finger protein XlCGF8.2DB-like [Solea solea]|uniref:gastrula zinc finger protein XlCGF8.2DB-like n=1 Tax=Solea solea TaxID=90069 RepID=UPI00272BE09C|nr:gastrula zinc finger protein XlCGF8.2DB-like [Solea solea]